MSQTVIFIVGSVIFAISVYGVVAAGGTALSRAHVEQNPHLKENADGQELKKRFPFRLKG